MFMRCQGRWMIRLLGFFSCILFSYNSLKCGNEQHELWGLFVKKRTPQKILHLAFCDLLVFGKVSGLVDFVWGFVSDSWRVDVCFAHTRAVIVATRACVLPSTKSTTQTIRSIVGFGVDDPERVWAASPRSKGSPTNKTFLIGNPYTFLMDTLMMGKCTKANLHEPNHKKSRNT